MIANRSDEHNERSEEFTLTPLRVSDSIHVPMTYSSDRQELRALPLIPRSSERTYAYRFSARWCLLLTLVWSMFWPVTGFEFNSPSYAETGPASQANHPALKQAKRLIDAG